jgi:hypothetical protein
MLLVFVVVLNPSTESIHKHCIEGCIFELELNGKIQKNHDIIAMDARCFEKISISACNLIHRKYPSCV